MAETETDTCQKFLNIFAYEYFENGSRANKRSLSFHNCTMLRDWGEYEKDTKHDIICVSISLYEWKNKEEGLYDETTDEIYEVDEFI